MNKQLSFALFCIFFAATFANGSESAKISKQEKQHIKFLVEATADNESLESISKKIIDCKKEYAKLEEAVDALTNKAFTINEAYTKNDKERIHNFIGNMILLPAEFKCNELEKKRQYLADVYKKNKEIRKEPKNH